MSVEHLIVHNVSSHNAQSLNNIMSEGKEILFQIPGVREVFAGEAMEENSKYHFCWSVRFTDKTALDSFHQHQAFDAFLKKQFKPNVSDLVNVNYLENK